MKNTVIITILIILSFSGKLFAEIYGDTIDYEIHGKITYKAGKVVIMQQLSGENVPKIGCEGELSKSFETDLFGGKVRGWLVIGDMKVTNVSMDLITFSLIKELSIVTENGVKKNHFVIGEEVKFIWKVAVTPDEAEFKKGQDIADSNMFEALTHYKKAVAINPRHDKAMNMIGIIMNETEALDSALFYFKKAFELNPKNEQYAKNISITSYKSGSVTDGYDYAAKAVASDSTDPEAWYLRSLMYYIKNKDSLADADKKNIMAGMDKAVQLTAEDPFYYGERAYMRNIFGNPAGACEDAKKAKELGAENGDELIKTYCP